MNQLRWLTRTIALIAIFVSGYIVVTQPHLLFGDPDAPPPIRELAQAYDCGAEGEACEVSGRHYNALIPKGDGPFPVVMFFHGSHSNGDKIVVNHRLAGPLLERGYALVAPTALDITYSGNRRGTGWLNEGQRGERDDHRFVIDVIGDMGGRFPIDRDRILMAGHSNGAIFLWYLACADIHPKLRSFAPINGTPVRHQLGDCENPRPRFNLLHTHGRLDETVPFIGRNPADGSWSTLGAEEAMTGLLTHQNCGEITEEIAQPFRIHTWTRCNSNHSYKMVVFEGGHFMPRAWPDFALDWFEGLVH